jgi:xanthine/uracil permease
MLNATNSGNGAVVAIIGFNLAPSAWTNFKGAPITALVTLLAVMLVGVLFKGMIGRLNILLGVLVGYAFAYFRGEVKLVRYRTSGMDRFAEVPSSTS